ncbi:protein transport protein SEC24 [Nematocida homosporus]|uniref:protein transport protein SEC24 n=1 Tax=Nematocida homosporus TaxID=1912981 RepID=UPI002220C92B|nr:protein transport protein SEC24 [Nematocida homosporus]KAI5187576.1 protein transport protein SEC24 [Nematocida homosporus]
MHIGAHPSAHSAAIENDELIAYVKGERYLYTRCTFTSAPEKKADLKKTGVPFVVSVTPLPAISLDEAVKTPTAHRCTSCQAYINPYCEVIPPGYKWRCSICKSLNDVSSPLHSYGASLRVFSPNENAENNRSACGDPLLTYDVIEFPSSLERATPPPPVFVFAIEATVEAIERGALAALVDEIPEALAAIEDPHHRAELAILFFGQSVQVLRLNQDKPVLDTINEIDGTLPMLMDSEYVVSLKTVKDRLPELLTEAEKMILHTEREVPSNFGLVLKVASHILHRGGHVQAFISSAPAVKECAVPAGACLGTKLNYYDRLTEQLLARSVSVSLFILASKTVEAPALLSVVESTGGDLRYYPAFLGNHEPDRESLHRDLVQHLGSCSGSHTYCRVRSSEGVTIRKYWGVVVQDSGLIKLPLLRRGKTFSFEADYDTDLVLKGISFQVAVIYNSVAGERTVRVLNFTVELGPTGIDPQATVHAIALQALDKECATRGAGAQCAATLAASAIMKIGVDGAMGAFPRLVYGLVKNKVFKGVSPDLRAVLWHGIRTLPVSVVDAIIYPILVRIDEEVAGLDEEGEEGIALPYPLRLSATVIGTDGTYLLDAGIVAYTFTGESSGYQVCGGMEGRVVLPEDEDHARVRAILEHMVSGRVVDPTVYSVHQQGHAFLLEGFQAMLLEDGPSSLSGSLADFSRKLLSAGYAK